jgi:hypothetical protein
MNTSEDEAFDEASQFAQFHFVSWINLFENLHSFKVTQASDLISWLDFLLDDLFLCFGQGVYRQCIGIPMGTNCAVYLANFHLFTYKYDFIKLLLKSNTCPVVLHRLSLVCRFVDDLFVPDFPDFVNFMYHNQDSFGSGIYPKTSCELSCMSKGFSFGSSCGTKSSRFML